MISSKGVQDNSDEFVAKFRASLLGDVPLERPEFVPNDHLCFEDALTLVGQTLFDEKWTGEGVRRCYTEPKYRSLFDVDDYAKSLGVAPSSLNQEQREEALRKGQEHREGADKCAEEIRTTLRQILYRGEVTSIILSEYGKRSVLDKDVWLAKLGRNILYNGWIFLPDEDIETRGFLLINREQLLHALAQLSCKANAELSSKLPMKDISEGNARSVSKRKGRPPTVAWTKALMTAAWWYDWHRPEKTADLERFIHCELEALGIEAGESTVRAHATRLIKAHQGWLERAEK